MSLPAYHVRGEASPNAKLTEGDVQRMRKIRREQGISWAELAREFGVTARTAQRTCNYLSWKHVP